jgi:multisubunit Na+/H+ antiporter MnhF subunit
VSALEWVSAGLLVLAVLLAAARLFLGPTTPDRVVAADTLAVITTPALAWVASAFGNPIYLDIALVYGALSFVVVVAIARALEGPRS